MKNIAGIFYDRPHAHEAVAALLERGFTHDDISIIMSDKAKDRHFHKSDNTDDIAKGGAAGAVGGGALGALIAGLAAVGTITVPGAGLLVAGPIVAVLSGVGAGATVGGFAGALAGAGFAMAEAKRYEDEVRKGNIVLVVRTKTEEEILAAHDAMRQHEAMTEAV